MTKRQIIGLAVGLSGATILWIFVNPWAVLGVFLWSWGNNINYSAELKKRGVV